MAINLSFFEIQEAVLTIPEPLGGSVVNYSPVSPMRIGHHHRELEMNLVTEGRAAYVLGDRRYELQRNSLVWLFPGQDHILINKTDNYGMYLGLFKPSLIEAACRNSPGSALVDPNPPGHFCRQISEEAACCLATIFDSVSAIQNDIDRTNAGLGWALLSSWHSYNSSATDDDGVDLHPAVDRAVRMLRSTESFDSMEQVAKHAGVSLSRLSKVFKAQMGMGLVEFRNRQRLEIFFSEYGTGRKCTVTEAAYRAGFGSYAQFHRIFRQYTGRGPAQFRRSLTRL